SVVAALGTVVALGGGLLADAALKSSPLFQQVRFGLYYLGFAAIVWGTVIVIRGCVQVALRRWIVRVLVVAFIVSLIVGGVFVFVPSTFVLNQYREQIQLAVYWVPLLVAAGGGSIALFVASADTSTLLRSRLRLIGLFEGLLFVGLLRESQILPDLGDPLLNLLVSFVPFVVGAVLLAIAVRPSRAVDARAT
ncbi:MAG TPA: hypothetical protein VGM38_05625, partial [Pseudolysinimonas sp.]